ncbi:serine hydrolase domain-containing protein [Pacificimonas sp. ICDLI1SI03]
MTTAGFCRGMASPLAVALATLMITPGAALAAQPATETAVAEVDATRLAQLPAFIDTMVADQLENSEVAGAVVSVVNDGEVIFNKGYGYQNIEAGTPVNPDATLFRPGSVSKLFAWTALMQQVEQGKVDLDADINEYIDFEIPRNGFEPITVRNLFSHTPGMSDVGGIIVRDPKDVLEFEEWIKARVPRRVWAPGVETAYSNYGSAIAGYIVQRVSGESFEDYVERHIFQPLGMDNTTVREPFDTPEMKANLATGYRVEDGKMIPQDPEYVGNILPAGSSSSTGADMAKFMMAMVNGGELNGNRILQPETVQMMQGNLSSFTDNLPGMAYGFMVYRDEGPRLIGHGGNTGDFHSDLVIAPDLDLGYFISMTGGEGSSEARTVLKRAIEGFLFPQQPAPRWDGEEETAPLGRYRSNRRDFGRPVNPEYDTIVTSLGEGRIEIKGYDDTSTWERIGPHLYEKVTDVPEGGPYDRVEFYDTPRGPRMAYGSSPYTAYHYVDSEE